MRPSTGHYELSQISDHSRCEDIEIDVFGDAFWESRRYRRRLLQAGILAAAVLATLSGACARGTSDDPDERRAGAGPTGPEETDASPSWTGVGFIAPSTPPPSISFEGWGQGSHCTCKKPVDAGSL